MAIVVLAIVSFLSDYLREKRSVSLTKQASHILKILMVHWLKITALIQQMLLELLLGSRYWGYSSE